MNNKFQFLDNNDCYIHCVVCGLKGPWIELEDICYCCGCHFGVSNCLGGELGEDDISSEFSLGNLKKYINPADLAFLTSYEDIQATKEYRKRWLNGVLKWQKGEKEKWFNEKGKPKSWNLEKQMKNIPEIFK